MSFKTFPYHMFLFPLFFVVHACTEHYFFLDTSIIIGQAVKYLLYSFALYLLSLWLYKNSRRAGIIVFLLLSVNFFFPALHNLLKHTYPGNFFSRYVFILPFLLVVVPALLTMVYKKRYSFVKLTYYLNIVMLLFILSDVAVLLYRQKNSFNRVSSLDAADLHPNPNSPKPDIYFLVFDEYNSSAALKNEYGYDNSQLDTFLINKGFSIQAQSRSNYNWTQFSLASILNMSYLKIPDPDAIVFADYLHAARLINNNKVALFLKSQGYQIENYSIFDFGGKKAVLKDNFLNPATALITDRTFVNTVLKDIGWNFIRYKMDWHFINTAYNERFDNIQMGIDLIKKTAQKKTASPRFVYGHLLMPHSPFYMNKTVRTTSIQQLVADASSSSPQAYVNYLYYTNQVVIDIIKTIRAATDNKAVIIFMGDHGFRPPSDLSLPAFYFQNQNAVYYPEKKSNHLYGSITGVNQFRVILNDLFQQNLPLLKDSMVYLKDKK